MIYLLKLIQTRIILKNMDITKLHKTFYHNCFKFLLILINKNDLFIEMIYLLK